MLRDGLNLQFVPIGVVKDYRPALLKRPSVEMLPVEISDRNISPVTVATLLPTGVGIAPDLSYGKPCTEASRQA